MDALTAWLPAAGSVAAGLLLLALVGAAGLALGKLHLGGIRLGIGGVLFAGLAAGHLGLTMEPGLLGFVRELGLVLFVFGVGLQVGPGFFASLRREGLPLNALAAGVVVAGACLTVAVSTWGGVGMPVAAGLFAGATTNTPSLAAAQEALRSLPETTAETTTLPGLGYAVAYPFGILGILLTMALARRLFRVDVAAEEAVLARRQEEAHPELGAVNLEVTNPNLEGLSLAAVPVLDEPAGVVVTRIMHDGQVGVAHPDTVLHRGDVLLAVGPGRELERLRVIVGEEAALDLRSVRTHIATRRLVVTRKRPLGRTLSQLDLRQRFGVNLTRITRGDVQLSPKPGLHLQYGDLVMAVGEPAGLDAVAAELGDSPRELTTPDLLPVLLGIAAGVVLGMLPLALPGVPAPVRLGLAGGPLLVALALSRIGHLGPLVWYLPPSANLALRELGIVLFLAAVGIRAGDRFVATLVAGDGLAWMGLAALITLVPLLAAALVGRLAMRLNFLSLCGLLAGSMTDPPALAFASRLATSDAPAVSYATVYPLTMILRVVCAQLLVLVFV
jgi:putative transport protein